MRPADNGNGTNFTPPFPSYPSGHADFGGALFTVLKDFYGTDNIHFTIVSDEFNTITVDQNGQPRPLVPRSYTSFSQAMAENAESRIYLGIHFQFDATTGSSKGARSGTTSSNTLGQPAMNVDEAFVNKAYRDLTGHPHRRRDARDPRGRPGRGPSHNRSSRRSSRPTPTAASSSRRNSSSSSSRFPPLASCSRTPSS